jgi:hypothetical protein
MRRSTGPPSRGADRPDLLFADHHSAQASRGVRLAPCLVPNLEHYEYMPSPVRLCDPWPRMPHPDVLGYSMCDYGYAFPCTVSLKRGLRRLAAPGLEPRDAGQQPLFLRDKLVDARREPAVLPKQIQHQRPHVVSKRINLLRRHASLNELAWTSSMR